MRTRRVVFNLHLYIGLAAGLFLVMSGLTGSIIVFREEIDELMHPKFLETLEYLSPEQKNRIEEIAPVFC